VGHNISEIVFMCTQLFEISENIHF
jgi:hypothetical protein